MNDANIKMQTQLNFMQYTTQLSDEDDIETCKWINKIYFIIYKNDKPLGYTQTEQEADLICDRDPTLQWGRTKRNDSIHKLELMVCS